MKNNMSDAVISVTSLGEPCVVGSNPTLPPIYAEGSLAGRATSLMF